MCTLMRQCRSALNKYISLYNNTHRNYVCGLLYKNLHKDLLPIVNFDIYKCQFHTVLVNQNDGLLFRPNNSFTFRNKVCINTNKKDTLLNDKNMRTDVLENVIEHNKEMFRETEQRLRQKSNVIIEDIKATRNKMKERMEEVIEKENIYTIPNFLCVSRIAVTPYIGLLIIQSNYDLALAFLGIAALTDLLDGWIARTWKNQSTRIGSFLDPMADKILIATLFLTLTYNGLIPFALTAMIITRDVILVAAGFVIRYKSLPPPVIFH